MEKFGRYAFLIVLIGIVLLTAGAIEISRGPSSSTISREIPTVTPYSVSSVENRTRELESGEFVVGTDSYNKRKLVVDLRNKDPESDRVVYSFKVKDGSINVYILDSGNYTLWAMGLPYLAEARLDDVQEETLEFIPKSSGIYYLIYDNSSSPDPETSKSVSDSGREFWTATAVETRYRTEYRTEVKTIYDYGRVYYGYAAFLPGLSLFLLGSVPILRSSRKPSALTRQRVPEMPTRIEAKPQPTVRIIPIETSPSMDDKVFDYIVEHEGVISLSRTSEELRISMEELNASVERLKKEGRIE